jgi:hypothetical protein
MGKTEWAMGSKTYVKNAVKVVESLIAEDDPEAKLKTTARNPIPSGYKPELYVTTELNDELGSRFLQLIGILRWAIELGRLDIFVEVSQLSQHQALPRRGHLEALYHIFAYLRSTRMVRESFSTRKSRILMNMCSIQTPIGAIFTGTFRRRCHRICQNQNVKV